MPSAKPHYRIGQAAARAGVSAANIRFYEKQGLLGLTQREGNSYRSYTDHEIHQLRFIRLCRAMDMSLDEVRTLLGLDLRKKSDCALATLALDAHIGHVRDRMAELKSLMSELVELRGRCDGRAAKCRIIEALHAKAEQLPFRTSAARIQRHV